jgi:hypothetical protein
MQSVARPIFASSFQIDPPSRTGASNSNANTYVKHDDAVIEEEIKLVLEITASFMKHLVRLSA